MDGQQTDSVCQKSESAAQKSNVTAQKSNVVTQKSNVTTQRSTLVTQRGRVKASLSRIGNYFESKSPSEVSVNEIKVRLERLNGIWERYDEIQNRIEDLDISGEFSDENEEDRSHFELMYFNINSKLEDLMVDNTNNVQKETKDKGNVNNTFRIQPISLPNFDGKPETWVDFYNTFRSLVHDEPNISKVQKHLYLKSVLKGAAADVISSLPVSESNYDVAWDTLCDHYQNSRFIIDAHVSALADYKKIKDQSADSLEAFYHNINKHIKALSVLKLPVDSWDVLLLHILTAKLDDRTLTEWEEEISKEEGLIKLQTFQEFLKKKSKALKAVQSRCSKRVNFNNKQTNNRNVNLNSCLLTNNVSVGKCHLCKEPHYIFYCKQFLKQSISERWNTIKKLNLCNNCFSNNHKVRECKSRNCKICNKRHNSLLHDNDWGGTQSSDIFKNKEIQSPSNTLSATTANTEASSLKLAVNNKASQLSLFVSQPKSISIPEQVLLQTASIYIRNKNGELHKCRVLLDSGSTLNLITEKLAKILNLVKSTRVISVKGIGHGVINLTHSLKATIFSNDLNYNRELTFYTISKISSGLIPNQSFYLDQLDVPEQIKGSLADPDFNKSLEIEALLGAEIYFELFNVDNNTELQDYGLFKRSNLGWVVSGKVPNVIGEFCQNKCFLSSSTKQVSQQLEEAVLVENIFQASHIRDETGRFVVDLPLKDDPCSLGDSYEGALQRFLNLERKLQKDPNLLSEYKKFLQEYIDLGHMETVPQNELNKRPHYYLPHHAIFKDSTTTQIRVVFDASFKTKLNKSLNDILITGPALQNELFGVLLRFRKYTYAVSGDICKMYRMILVNKDHINLQRILWRNTPEEIIRHYRLRTVTYGTNSAPYLAIRCLLQLAIEAQEQYPEAANLIKNQFYVDDLLFSNDSEQCIIELQKETSQILLKGGFQLRKWCTNSNVLLEHLTSLSSDTHYIVDIGNDGSIKALGLIWKPSTDTLEFKMHETISTHNVTKRQILSDIAKLFDPLGLLTPVIILAKIFVQELWQAQLGWDESLPKELNEKWISYRKTLQELNNIKISRHINAGSAVHLHGFCDASEKAYACSIYLVSKFEDKFISLLVCAKGKVAAIKRESLPRLELCGAVMLAKLMDKVANTLEIPQLEKTFWTDSMIVLAWISGIPQQWKTYVGNRVSQIQELSEPSQWRHVSSGDNPADVATRGILTSRFKGHRLWWSGPTWLTDDPELWPSDKIEKFKSVPESREIKYSLLVEEAGSIDFVDKFSSWKKLTRVVAWMLRFIKGVRSRIKQRKINSTVTLSSNVSISALSLELLDITNAKLVLLRELQRQEFANDIINLQDEKIVQKKSKLRALYPYLDQQGLIRVGGRLNAANLPYSQKHPVVLPYKSHITNLIVEQTHKEYLHIGPQGLLSIVRQKYWPLHGRSITKNIVNKCVICFRAKPMSKTQLMSHLPSERVTPSKPFTTTGVDFSGPIYIRSGLRRVVATKAYVAVFVCFCTRAVHLELVSDLSTNAFMAALRRFFARRGKSATIFSDNGTNFVGAAKELQKLFQDSRNKSIKDHMAEQGVDWNFIPAGSPHFGGLWEAAVKSMKHHLIRAAGKSLLTFEEMNTLLCQIEACLNSRPLTPCSSDPSEFECLTPAHFLVGSSLQIPDSSDFTSTPLNRLKRWQLVQASAQQFWKRWSLEYLNTLQQRTKWTKREKNLTKDQLVLIREENVPPLQWRIGRIDSLHPGSDGCVRVASVKLPNGNVIRRAVAKLCPLPIDVEQVQGGENVGHFGNV